MGLCEYFSMDLHTNFRAVGGHWVGAEAMAQMTVAVAIRQFVEQTER
jgi:hypothetical protein